MSTYTPIAKINLTSAVSSVTFSNIPQTYTDLILVATGKTSADGIFVNIRFNGNASTLYSSTRMTGNGSTAASSRTSSASSISLTPNVAWDSTDNQNIIINLTDYNNTTIFKNLLARSNVLRTVGPYGETSAIAGLYRSTSAISSVEIFTGSSTFQSGATFNLYGITAGSPKAFGGNKVTTDGTYWYHTYTSSGTFRASTSLTADCLVVAGGGGGQNAGGGAGGLCFQANRSILASTNYVVTIGGGGVGKAVNTGSAGTNGGNSIFDTITAIGGGSSSISQGNNGGSGAGGYSNAGLEGTATQTNSGGATGYGNNGSGGGNGRGGGGGGAGSAAPSYASAPNGQVGGDGLNTWSSWATATGTGASGYYAGGGGGRNYGSATSFAGGAGGGGAGNSIPGTDNTGGGGGASSGSDGNNGGSGIVIIRYAV